MHIMVYLIPSPLAPLEGLVQVSPEVEGQAGGLRGEEFPLPPGFPDKILLLRSGMGYRRLCTGGSTSVLAGLSWGQDL